MELDDNLIDIVIGPIENYEDRMFNYKAAYEAAVMIKDIAASEELDIYKSHLDALERNLPIADQYKKETVGSGNVLEIVNIVYFGGDFQAGVKTIAASLPNDERVISEKGAKKQLYKNIIEAKYSTILTKIADILINKEQKHQRCHQQDGECRGHLTIARDQPDSDREHQAARQQVERGSQISAAERAQVGDRCEPGKDAEKQERPDKCGVAAENRPHKGDRDQGDEGGK